MAIGSPRPERLAGAVVWCAPDVQAPSVLDVLKNEGVTLKHSKKSVVRRVGPYVSKEAPPRGNSVLAGVKSAWRQRRIWHLSLAMTASGVPIPKPVAYIEWRRAGLPQRTAQVAENLEGWIDVEEHSRSIALHDAPAALERIAAAIRTLDSARVFHSDLSGKNIYTDGSRCCIIDIEACRGGVVVEGSRRLRMLVQLYDSFCDVWPDSILGPFVAGLGADTVGGLDAVRRGQHVRRARIEAIWRAEGKMRQGD